MTDVEKIKSKIDVVSFINEYVPLKKSGRTYKGLCPFHHEKTPSFYVSPERGTWHCFGACNEGGDVISFLEKWENIEFLEALKILAEKTGVTLSGYQPTESFSLKEKLYGINKRASEFYSYILTSHKFGEKAREYVEKRQIKSQTIKTFAMGYAPNSWDSLKKFLVKKGYSELDILLAGLGIKSEKGRVYDRFRGRLMFPLKDTRGNVIGFSGRVLPPASEKEAKYINSPETPVYTKGNTLFGLDITRDSIKKEKCAVVVEGEFDMIASFQSGVSNVVAIKGSAFTEEQVALLRRYTEEVLLGLDADFAGNEASRRGIEIAERGGLTVKVVKLRAGKDPAECVSMGAHLWKESVKNAVPIYDFIMETAEKKYSKEEVLGKKKIGEEVVPFLSRITNPIVLSHYTKKLAKLLSVSDDAIEQMVESVKRKERKPLAVFINPPKQSRSEQLEEYLLSLVIQAKDPISIIKRVASELDTNNDFDKGAVGKIFSYLKQFSDSHNTFSIQDAVKDMSTELLPVFDRAFITDITNVLEKNDIYEKEMGKAIKDVKKTSLRRKMSEFTTNIKKAESEANEEELEKLRSEVKKVSARLLELEK